MAFVTQRDRVVMWRATGSHGQDEGVSHLSSRQAWPRPRCCT